MTRIAALPLCLLLLSCEPDTVRLLEFADAGLLDAEMSVDAGDGSVLLDGSTLGRLCTTNAECDAGQFCSAAGCGGLEGRCQSRPSQCDSEAYPVCGCNGLIYLNDCVRRKSGVGLNVLGAFCDRIRCGDGMACPNNSRCMRVGFMQDSCSYPMREGSCVVLPERCDNDVSQEDSFTECGRADSCVNLCNAIASEKPHQASRCRPRF